MLKETSLKWLCFCFNTSPFQWTFLNISWKQHPTKQRLYRNLPDITTSINMTTKIEVYQDTVGEIRKNWPEPCYSGNLATITHQLDAQQRRLWTNFVKSLGCMWKTYLWWDGQGFPGGSKSTMSEQAREDNDDDECDTCGAHATSKLLVHCSTAFWSLTSE